MGLFAWIGVFIGALAVLLFASDKFIGAAEKIGLSLGIPSFIVGVTIVAAGTSLPELISSIFAVLEGSPEIVVGNVVGSNITNILLVLGVTAMVAKNIEIKFAVLDIDLPLFIGSAFLLYFLLMDGYFGTFDAIVCLAGLLIFLFYTFSSDREEEEGERPKLTPIVFVMLALSGIGIWFGAEWTVKSVIKIADMVGIGKEVVALSMVALGTSMPEIVVSVMAARKGNAEMAVGNVLGSNIFNTFAVMGIPALFGGLVIPESILVFSLPMMVAASILFLIMSLDKKIAFAEGAMLLLFYVVFIVHLFTPA